MPPMRRFDHVGDLDAVAAFFGELALEVDSTVEQRQGIIRSLIMAAMALGDAYAAAAEER